MRERFVGQRININVFVKLWKNGSDSCAMLYEAYGEKLWKSRVSEWHIRFKENCKNMENDERSDRPRPQTTHENVEKRGFWWAQAFKCLKSGCAIIFRHRNSESVWTFDLQLNSTPWQCSRSLRAFCQRISHPKIDYWKWTPALLHWFGSEWLLTVYKCSPP